MKPEVRRHLTAYFVQALFYHWVGDNKQATRSINCSLTFLYPVADLLIGTLN